MKFSSQSVPAFCSLAQAFSSGQARRLPRLILLLVLTLLQHPLLPVAAQEQPAEQAPIKLQVEAGYDGSYRVSQWFPITVIASNDGPDIQGVLEWRYPTQDDNQIFRREIDLPRGARKRIMLQALSNNFARTAELRLLVNNQVVASEQLRIDPIEAEQFVVGIISSDATLLNSLAALSFNVTSGTSIVRLDPAFLPTQEMMLAGMDAIFIHDTVTADWSDEQRAALGLWVRLGGQLVVSGGANAEFTAPGLADLLPVSITGLESDVPLTSLKRFVPQDPLPEGSSTTVSRFMLQPGAVALDDAQLLTTRPVGNGQVIFTAFDVSVLRAWTGEPELWEDVLEPAALFAPAAAFRWQNSNLLPTVLQLPALNLPSFWVLVLYIAGYILVVGPLNFLVLRRLKRIDLAWLTIPATVLLFVAGTYGASFLLRGIRPQVFQASVVQGFEGAEQGQATVFLGIFSPQRNTYELTFPAETLVSMGRFDTNSLVDLPLVWTDAATYLRDVLVDVSSLRTFIVEQTVPVNVQVRSNLQRTGRQIAGDIQNVGNTPLNDALLVYGDTAESLGSIAPGATQTVSFRTGQNNFPQGTNASTEGLFNRDEMLISLFSGGMFVNPVRFAAPGVNPAQNVLDNQGIYLLAWSDQPLAGVQLTGTSDEAQGVTLYVMRLQP